MPLPIYMIDNQTDTIHLLKKSYENLKKESKNRRTPTILENYERSRVNYWTVIENNHPKLLEADPSEEYKKLYDSAVAINQKFIATLKKFYQDIGIETGGEQTESKGNSESETEEEPKNKTFTLTDIQEEDEESKEVITPKNKEQKQDILEKSEKPEEVSKNKDSEIPAKVTEDPTIKGISPKNKSDQNHFNVIWDDVKDLESLEKTIKRLGLEDQQNVTSTQQQVTNDNKPHSSMQKEHYATQVRNTTDHQQQSQAKHIPTKPQATNAFNYPSSKQTKHSVNWEDQVLQQEFSDTDQAVRSNQSYLNSTQPNNTQQQLYMNMPGFIYNQAPYQAAPSQYVPYMGQQYYYPYAPQYIVANDQNMYIQPNFVPLPNQTAGGRYPGADQIPQSYENTGAEYTSEYPGTNKNPKNNARHEYPSNYPDANEFPQNDPYNDDDYQEYSDDEPETGHFVRDQNNKTHKSKNKIDFETAFTEFLRLSNMQMKKSKLPQQKLSIFEGNLLEFPQWKETFLRVTDGASNTEKMVFLLNHTKGEPKLLLTGLQVDERAFHHAWGRLNKKYNNKRTLLKTNIQQALSKDYITKPKDSNSLLKWNSVLQSTANNLSRLRITPDEIITELFALNLDENTRLRWEDYRGAKSDPALPNKADDFVTKELAVFQGKPREVHINPSAVQSTQYAQDRYPPKRHENRRPTQTMVTTENAKEEKVIKCFICEEPHLMFECQKFLDMDDKVEALIQKKVCIYCGKHKWNMNSPCKQRSSLKCTICQKDHITLLHPREKTTAVTQKLRESMVLMPTAIAKVENKNMGTTEVRCLFDQASQSSYITSKAQKELGLKKHITRIIVKGINDSKQQIIKSYVNLKIHANHAKTGMRTIIVKAYVLPKIAGDVPSKTVMRPAWMDDIVLADPSYQTSQGIDILLGAELAAEILLSGEPTQVREGLVLTPTIFGHIVSGKGKSDSVGDQSHEIVSTYVTWTESMIKAMTDESLNAQIAAFLELPEVQDAKTKDAKIEEAEYCEKLFQETTTRDAEVLDLSDSRKQQSSEEKDDCESQTVSTDKEIEIENGNDNESQGATDDVVTIENEKTDCESHETPDDTGDNENQKIDNKRTKPKKLKTQKPTDFDPIKPELRRSSRIKNKLTIKQVLMTWFTLLTTAHAYEMMKLTPGIHVYKKNDISIKAADWEITSISLLNVTESALSIKTQVNAFIQECDEKINVTSIKTYCTQLARQLKEKEKTTNELVHSIYSPRKRRFVGAAIKSSFKFVQNHALAIFGSAVVTYQAVDTFTDKVEINKLQGQIAKTQKRLHDATEELLNSQAKSVSQLTEQLESWQEKFHLKNVEQKVEASFIAISNLMTQTLETHRRLVSHWPVELFRKEFERQKKDSELEAPKDWEQAYHYSVLEPTIVDGVAAVTYKVPLAYKKKLTVYDIVSVADENMTRPIISTTKLGMTIALNHDNTTYFEPHNELLIAPRFYEFSEFTPLQGCMKMAINPANTRNETCIYENYDSNFTTIHKLDDSAMILQLAAHDNSTLIICIDSKYAVPPNDTYIINVPNCIVHNEMIPALYAKSLRSRINVDDLKSIDITIPIRPSIELVPITLAPEWYQELEKAREDNEKPFNFTPDPYLYLPSTGLIILLIVLALIYCRYCRKTKKNVQDLPMVKVEVSGKTDQPNPIERPIVILDSQNQTARYKPKESKRRDNAKPVELNVPGHTEKF